MYYQNYEDYMRSVLGYQIDNQNVYENYPNMPYQYPNYPAPMNYNNDIMELYPETYKLIHPIVCKMCEANTKPITRELLNDMTEEIYMSIENEPEIDNIINVRVNLPKENTNTEISRTAKNNTIGNNKTNVNIKVQEKEIKEDRKIRRNPTLQDLIKIIILNHILEGSQHHKPYPPYPPRPRENRNYYQI